MFIVIPLVVAGAGFISGVAGFVLARKALTWIVLGATAAFMALALSFVPSIPALIEVSRGSGPIGQMVMLFTVPPAVVASFVGSCSGVVLTHPPAPTARRVAVFAALATLPTVVLSWVLHYLFFRLFSSWFH